MDINQKTALKIREAREEKNFTQHYMATQLDITKNSYSLFELGKTKIHLNLLFKICELLEMPVDKMLDLSGNNIQTNDNSFVIMQNNNGTLHFTFSEEMMTFFRKKK